MVLFIDGLGISIALPLYVDLFLIPKYSILEFSATQRVRNIIYGLSLVSFSLGMFIASPILGQLSDKYGRKKILALSLAGTIGGYIISAVGVALRSPTLFIIGRIIDGLSAGSIPIAQAAISDISTESNKAGNLGLILFAVTSGYVLGPICAEIFSKIISQSLTAPFYAIAFLSVVSLLFLLPMKETAIISKHKKIEWATSVSIFSILKKARKAALPIIAFLCFQLCWTIYFQFSPHLLAEIGYSDITAHILACIGSGMALSFCFLTRFFQSRLNPEAGSKFAMTIMFMALLSHFIFPFSYITCFMASFLAAIGYGLGYSFLLVSISQKVSNDVQGLIMGVSASMSALSSVSTALLGTVIVNYNPHFILVFALICLIGSLLSLGLHAYTKSIYVTKEV